MWIIPDNLITKQLLWVNRIYLKNQPWVEFQVLDNNLDFDRFVGKEMVLEHEAYLVGE